MSQEWRLVKSGFSPKFSCECREYEHTSGMRHIHIDSKIKEMSFNVSFKTNPIDDTGIPHVLEHLVLCGSKKYPVKDPFGGMNGRTLAHSMNASTYPDKTEYYFATSHDKDFNNMAELYSDLVFNPTLLESDFMQEGWRIERGNSGEYTHAGVVFNEMKGAYSASNKELRAGIISIIDPASHEIKSSGGHPSAVASMSFNKVKKFYNDNYSSKNAFLVTGGPVDLDSLHNMLDGTLKNRVEFKINEEPKWIKASEAFNNVELPIKEVEEKTYKLTKPYTQDGEPTTTALMVNLIGDEYNSYKNRGALIIIDKIINRTDSMAYIEATKNSASFNMGNLQRVHSSGEAQVAIIFASGHSEDFNAVEFLKNVKNKIFEDINEQSFEAAKNTMLKDLISITDTIMPGSMVGETQEKIHDGRVDDIYIDFVKEIKKIKYSDVVDLANKIKNGDEFILSTETSKTLVKERAKLNEELLKIQVENGAGEYFDIINEKGFAESSKNNDLLPTLNSVDLETINLGYSDNIDVFEDGNINVVYSKSDSKTSLITLSVDVTGIPEEEYKDLIAMSRFIKEIPVKNKSINQMSADLYDNNMVYECEISISGKINTDQVRTELQFMMDTDEDKVHLTGNELLDRVFNLDFNTKNNIEQKVKIYLSDMAAKKSARQTSKLFNLVSSEFSINSKIKVITSDLSENAIINYKPEDACTITEKLSRVMENVKKCPMQINAMGNEKTLNAARGMAENILFRNIERINLNVYQENHFKNMEVSKPEVVFNDDAINTCFRAQPGPNDLTSKEYIAVKLGLKLLSKNLHEEVRVKGGAYGSSVSSTRGNIEWMSYRDPNVDRTFKAFSSIAEQASSMIISETDLLSAKLELIKIFVKPEDKISSAIKALDDYNSCKDKNFNIETAKRIFEVSAKDIQESLKKWLVNDNYVESAVISKNTPAEEYKNLTKKDLPVSRKIGV